MCEKNNFAFLLTVKTKMSKTKVIINSCYGGFGLSDEAIKMYRETCGYKSYNFYSKDARSCPNLVSIVEKLGKASFGKHSALEIIEIPSEFKDCYEINDYDGLESIKLNSELLVAHKLRNIDMDSLSLEESKQMLLEFKNIISTNYYEKVVYQD